MGSSGEGRTTHIKVHHKLDMLGIGAAHQKDPNGIAWKQNRDFENLLKRLNDPSGSKETDTGTRVDGFVGEGVKEGETVESRAVSEGEEKERTKKRRKTKGEDIGGEDISRKKKKTDDGEIFEAGQKSWKDNGEEENVSEATTLVSSGESTPVSTSKPPISRHP